MTQASLAFPGIAPPRFGLREAGLWAAAAALVLAAHVAVAYALQEISFADSPDGGPPPALAIEMAPLVTAPAIPEESAMADAVSPDPPDAAEDIEKPTELKPVTEPALRPALEQPEPMLEPAPTEKPVAATEAEAPQPAMTALSEQQPLEEVVPDITETVAPDVVIPLPQPKPADTPIRTTKPVEAKTKAERKKKPAEEPKPRQKKERAAPAARPVSTASVDAKAAARAAAPQTSDSMPRSSVGPTRWNASLAAWIRRHTRYPSVARSRRAEGSPNVTFTVDGSGRVVSARLARSSGDADLDRAALGALQGATVPAPPAELGARVTRTAPFTFSLRD